MGRLRESLNNSVVGNGHSPVSPLLGGFNNVGSLIHSVHCTHFRVTMELNPLLRVCVLPSDILSQLYAVSHYCYSIIESVPLGLSCYFHCCSCRQVCLEIIPLLVKHKGFNAYACTLVSYENAGKLFFFAYGSTVLSEHLPSYYYASAFGVHLSDFHRFSCNGLTHYHISLHRNIFIASSPSLPSAGITVLLTCRPLSFGFSLNNWDLPPLDVAVFQY